MPFDFRRLMIPLLLVAACMAMGQTTVDLEHPHDQINLPLDQPPAGTATLHLAATAPYFIMFANTAAPHALIAEPGIPRRFDRWYQASGSVDITFKQVVVGDQMDFSFTPGGPAGAPSAHLIPVATKPGSSQQIHITIVKQISEAGAQPPVDKPAEKPSATVGGKSPVGHTPEPISWTAIASIGLVAVILCVVAGALVLRGSQKRPPPPPPGPPPFVVQADARLTQDELKSIRQDLQKLEANLAGLGPTKAATPSGPDLSRFVEMSTFQDAIQGTRDELEKLRSGLRGELPKLAKISDQSRQALAKLAQDTNALRSLVEKEFDRISKEANKNLDSAARILSQEFGRDLNSARPSEDERALLTKRLDEALTSFFRQSLPSQEGLTQRRTWIQGIQRSAETVRNELAPAAPEIASRLNPGIEEAIQIDKEIEGMLEAAGAQRLRLNFQVDFSTSNASRESVVDGIASGLKTQIIKLEQPLVYFDRRIENVALASARNAADFIDLKVDEYRGNASLQRLLDQLIQMGRLEAIVPASGESFRSTEHAVVQTLPANGNSSHTVARVVTRGFRQGGRVLRKASIILFE
jgi:molecular chaperone GrpE (heat shock protein)